MMNRPFSTRECKQGADARERVLLTEIFLGLIFVLLPLSLAYAGQVKLYWSPDRAVKARISPISKSGESRVEVIGVDGKVRCRKDYSSEDGNQGLIVARAGWTADSKFFVFSMYSSGGHQPWQAPTFFYARSDNTVHDFDKYLPPVADADFVLKAPDFITLPIWTPFENGMEGSIMLPVTFRISDIIKGVEREAHFDNSSEK